LIGRNRLNRRLASPTSGEVQPRWSDASPWSRLPTQPSFCSPMPAPSPNPRMVGRVLAAWPATLTPAY